MNPSTHRAFLAFSSASDAAPSASADADSLTHDFNTSAASADVTTDVGYSDFADSAFFYDLFLHNPEALAVGSPDNVTLGPVNLAFARMHGYRSGELDGQPLACLFPPACHASVVAAVAHTNRDGFHEWEAEHVRKDGSVFPVWMKVRAVRDAQGTLRFRIASVQDITARKRLENDVLQTQRLLGTIADNSPAGISVKDRDGRYLLSNPLSDGALGVAPGGAIGKTDYDLFPAEYADVFRANDLAVLQTGLAQETEEIVPTPDGARIFLCLKFPLFDPDGAAYATGLIAAEITERREQRQRIEDLNARLCRAMQETHHRVKNNLQVITSLTEMQMEADGNVGQAKALRRIVQHIHTLAALHDLLTGKATLNESEEVVPMRELLKKMLPLLQSSLEGRRLHAHVEEVRFSSRRASAFALLVNELVSNAVKHGRGDIHLALKVAATTARLEVSDDGPGFAPGFDPQTAASTGLELIDSIVRYDLQGQAAFTNREQGGARVVVSFPLPEEQFTPQIKAAS